MEQTHDPIHDMDKEALASRLQRQHDALIDDEAGDDADTYQRWAEQIFRCTPRHRWFFWVWLMVLLWWSMQWQYNYANELREVARLEAVVKDLRYRHLFVIAELVRLERISSIEEQVKAQGLDLEHSSQPPYLINASSQHE